MTKNPLWRQHAWDIFKALERWTRVEAGGYASLKSVTGRVPKLDKMESFFISETLKYLYLIFCDDDVLPLKGIDKDVGGKMFVLNTEAQPILAWDD